MTLIAEIDEIINLLEADIPCNINAPKNQKLERRLQRDLANYFKALADAFPYERAEELYYHHVTESLGSDAIDMLDPILALFNANLVSNLNGQMLVIYLSAAAEMITWGTTKGGIPIAYEGPPIQQAISWAERHCAMLVTRMNEETKNRLAQVISDAIETKRGIPGLARDIRKSFEDMSKYRSQLIARTETANALGESFLERGRAMGIEAKEWVTAGGDVCEICLENEAAGVIPFESHFPSGHITVPAHPACRCACAPARLNR